MKLEIFRGEENITNRTGIQVEVGELVFLRAKFTPSPDRLQDTHWSIPERRIAGYQSDQYAGKVTELKDAALKSVMVGFYWVNGASKTVSFTGTAVYGGELVTRTATAGFTVNRPQGSITITGALDPAGTPTVRNGSSFIYLAAEINFSRSVNGGNGELAWVQIVENGTFAFYEADGSVYSATETGLDTSFPYFPNIDQTIDRPGAPNENPPIVRSELSYAFTMWLMYRPNKSGSIWIPLRSIGWYYYFTAYCPSPDVEWNYTGGIGYDGSDTERTDFPIWDHTVGGENAMQ